MFLDADDVLGPTALEALADALRPGAIAACPWYRLDERGGVWVRRPASCTPRRPDQDALAGWLSAWYHPPCSVLWSREAFDVVGRWDGRGGPNDDGHVMMQALARGVPLVLTDRGEAFYRRLRPTDAPSVSSGRLTEDGLRARLWVLEQLAETLEGRGRLGSLPRPARRGARTARPRGRGGRVRGRRRRGRAGGPALHALPVGAAGPAGPAPRRGRGPAATGRGPSAAGRPAPRRPARRDPLRAGRGRARTRAGKPRRPPRPRAALGDARAGRLGSPTRPGGAVVPR